MKKVLYVGSKYSILRGGERELSFEHINIYLSLLQIKDISLVYYDFGRASAIGLEAASREIEAAVRKEKPDVLLVPINHELNKDIFKKIKDESKTSTVSLLCDEDTDLYTRSLAWAGIFDLAVVFYPPAYEEYKKRGINVVGVNWAANTDFFKKSADIKQDIDVSFVGAAKEERVGLVDKIKKSGINVECFGSGWENGPVSYEKMVEIFNRSKINLNLGMAKSIWRWQTPFRIFLSPAENFLGFRPDFWNWRGNLKTILYRKNPMSRARPFEISACGGFVITNRAPVFGEPFVENKEIVYFNDKDDLTEKIRYYLNNEELRKRIADAGYKRTLRDHSFRKRFDDIIEFVSGSDKLKHAQKCP